jgi:hypothetical protein
MTDRPDTRRPASSDPADIAAFEAKERRLEAEEKFRQDAYRHFGQSDAQFAALVDSVTAMRAEHHADMQAHETRDKERFADLESRFGPVTQSIGSNDNKVHWIIGIGVGAIGVVSLVGLYLTLRGAP